MTRYFEWKHHLNGEWMLKISWTLEDEKMIKLLNGVSIFLPPPVNNAIFWVYFFLCLQKGIRDTEYNRVNDGRFCVSGHIHCFQRFCVGLHYIAFNNSPCLVNIHALLKLFNAKPFFLWFFKFQKYEITFYMLHTLPPSKISYKM